MAKILVVYYSRTGNTRRVAEAISKEIGCDIEEIFDKKNRKGIIGYIRSGKDAVRKNITEIHDLTTETNHYDLILVETLPTHTGVPTRITMT